MTKAQAQDELAKFPGWAFASGGKAIRKEFVMAGFSAAAELIGVIAKIADAADHHPDVHLTGYRKLLIELTTHSAGGLTEKDFALAAQIEKLPKRLKV